MKEIGHENLNKFYGLCVANYEATIVTAHCSRGSLQVVYVYIDCTSLHECAQGVVRTPLT